jgi:hypothetical protein
MAVPADLIAHVAADLTGCEVDRGAPGTAVVTPRDAIPPFRLAVRSERRRLLHLQTLLVHVDGPSSPADEQAMLVFHHTGQVRRTGLAATVRPVGRRRRPSGEVPPSVAAVRDRLLSDGELEAASLTLDFTSFEVAVVDGAWRATLELMGGSHVRTTLPPSSRYVRLHPDQRDGLLATVAVLHARLPGTLPRVSAAPENEPPATAPAAGGEPTTRPDHLPRRPS